MRHIFYLALFAMALNLSIGKGVRGQAPDDRETTVSQDLKEMAKNEMQLLSAPGDVRAVKERFHGPESICDDDTRQRVNPPKRDAEKATCRLMIKFKNNPSRYVGTGFIVSKNLVLTAGHCVYDGEQEGGWAESIIIIPGSNKEGDEPFGSYAAARLYTVKGWTTGGDTNYDYAGLLVKDDAMSQKVGAVITLDVLNDAQLKEIQAHARGYPADKQPKGSQWWSQPAVKPDQVMPLKIAYGFDTFGGNSGGPVFQGNEDSTKAVAVHTNGGCPNSGTRITETRKEKILKEWAGQK